MYWRRLLTFICLPLALVALPWGVEQSQAALLPGYTPGVDYTKPNFAYSPPLRKFIDSLPGLGAGARPPGSVQGANNLGQYIPIAKPFASVPAGVPADGDYYEIGLVEYREQLHSDLPPVTGAWPNQSGGTKLRGYVDLNPASFVAGQPVPHYLGPIIIATKGKPVRLKFTNMLPLTAAGGKLFLPVDTTIMGAGMGPLTANGAPCDPSAAGATCASYTENRAIIHMHGGLPPWISDGTAHQWITPAGETTPFVKGASQQNVPDMPLPGNGSATFYWPNQQSGRLMFYHDHALGLTGVNVYAGEAAGYLLSDPIEEDALATAGVPGSTGTTLDLAHLIPMIIQDKTFVPAPAVLAATDPLWDTTNWGGQGSLWFPHIYMPNQDPASITGANALGRWDYGPWFWPVFPVATPNPPIVSHVPEAFMDTPLVNGTAYPYVDVAAAPYKLRILNASNDRMLNLQLYQADPLTIAVTSGGSGYTAPPVVNISAPPAGGTQAAATANMTGSVSGASITSGGVGYTTVPTVSITGIGTGAVGAATMSIGVTGVSGLVGGSGYTTAPTVTFNGGGATTPATATAVLSGAVSSFSVTTAGSYNSAPTVIVAPPTSGTTATATAIIAGTITGATVTNGGTGYTSAPTVVIAGNGSGATGTATVTNVVNLIIPTGGGSGYTSAPTVAITDTGTGTGTGATATATVTGPVNSFAVTAGGSGYTTAPTVAITGGGGIGASATATLTTGVINTIVVAVGGTGYTTPVITFTGGGTGATATATVLGGVITAINITSGGSGYTAPGVVITDAGGTGASATATTTGIVGAVTLVTQGVSYTSAPSVAFIGGGGTGATATAAISASLSGITITNAGSGYTAPIVTLTGGGGTLASAIATIAGIVNSVTVTTPGTGYTSALVPTVTLTGGGGTGATATAILTGGVSGITITNAGSGYTIAPAVSFSGAGTTAVASAILTSSVTGITINSAGIGYTSAPTIAIAAPTGLINPVQATVSATVGGVVSGVSISAGGTGYSTATTTISFSGGGASIQAIATPIVAGTVTGVTVTNPGAGYTSIPTVSFAAVGAGSGASAIASAHTEVKMVPATANPAIAFPLEWLAGTPGMIPDILDSRVSGVPNPAMRGPAMIQFGTEGGLLPGPVLLPNTPVGFEQNKRNIVVLNVLEKTLFMAPAERADVTVDFTPYAGKTIILYNDSPAPVPASDPRYDFYTGNPDNSATAGVNNQGGAPSTLPGYGPNTRTIMQFRVAGVDATPTVPGPVDYYNTATLAALQTGLPALFKTTQDTPVVPETAYTTIGYTGGAVAGAVTDTLARIQDLSLTFTPYGTTTPITMAMKNPTIQELFDPQGRMNSTLGVELPKTSALIQTTVPLGFKDPTTETIAPGQTQLWKITHNGVDTHGIHFHLVNVQVVNRVGWDGAIRTTDPNELGWKDTVRMNPLEDIIVAMRAKVPTVPFTVPDSIRPMDVTMPVGSTFASISPITGAPITVTNAITNFGHEYTWHCHILGHEEDDMMRPLVLNPNAKTEILWRNSSNGNDIIWKMDGINTISNIILPADPDRNWTIMGRSDFNGDGTPDILWRNTSNGANRIWIMNGTTVASTIALPSIPNQDWKIVGTGDFKGDGNEDILWWNSTNGNVQVEFMNRTTHSSYQTILGIPNTAWKIGGIGDFNGDGKPDILWQNTSNGKIQLGLMNGTTVSSYVTLPTESNLAWKIVGTGDFNNDVYTDILWRNTSTGEDRVWFMNGTTFLGTSPLNSIPNQAWQIVHQ